MCCEATGPGNGHHKLRFDRLHFALRSNWLRGTGLVQSTLLAATALVTATALRRPALAIALGRSTLLAATTLTRSTLVATAVVVAVPSAILRRSTVREVILRRSTPTVWFNVTEGTRGDSVFETFDLESRGLGQGSVRHGQIPVSCRTRLIEASRSDATASEKALPVPRRHECK